jgi:YVTN family beta-propeller protein
MPHLRERARCRSRYRPPEQNIGHLPRSQPAACRSACWLDGRTVYVAATMGDVVLRLDATTLAVQQIIPVGGEPDGLGVTAVMPRAECHACTPAP